MTFHFRLMNRVLLYTKKLVAWETIPWKMNSHPNSWPWMRSAAAAAATAVVQHLSNTFTADAFLARELFFSERESSQRQQQQQQRAAISCRCDFSVPENERAKAVSRED